jgi:hypothetical protein
MGNNKNLIMVNESFNKFDQSKVLEDIIKWVFWKLQLLNMNL